MKRRRIVIDGEEFYIPSTDIKDFLTKNLKKLWLLLLLFILIIWILSGFYIVQPSQQGVIRRFGRFVRTSTPGIHFKLPFPIEVVDKPKVMEVMRVEVGFRTTRIGPPAEYRDYPHESLMLTGDANIVELDFIVQFRIKDAPQYLFNVRDQENTIRMASEAAMRQVIGSHTIDDVLTEKKYEVQENVREILQNILDSYEIGVNVIAVQLQDVHPPENVMPAFKDVASAKEDKERLINEAQGYYNNVIPKTRGEAEKMVKEAEAYYARRVKVAEGEAERFLKILEEYRKAKEVTKERYFLETMERILRERKKFIVDTGKGSNLLNLLNLDSEKVKTIK